MQKQKFECNDSMGGGGYNLVKWKFCKFACFFYETMKNKILNTMKSIQSSNKISKGGGPLDEIFNQILSCHWSKPQSCDQILATDWGRREMIPLECSRGKEVIENHETLKFRIMIKSRIKPTILKFRELLYSFNINLQFWSFNPKIIKEIIRMCMSQGGGVSVMGKWGGENVLQT